jgi:hypothetical protein
MSQMLNILKMQAKFLEKIILYVKMHFKKKNSFDTPNAEFVNKLRYVALIFPIICFENQ